MVTTKILDCRRDFGHAPDATSPEPLGLNYLSILDCSAFRLELLKILTYSQYLFVSIELECYCMV